MPRRKRVPGYLLHKSTGHARVIINGRQVFLGKYNSPESIEKYRRLIAEMNASGGDPAPYPDERDGLTVAELLARYLKWANGYYLQSNETEHLKYALRPLKELYGRTQVSRFGPLALKAIRDRMVADGLSRPGINKRIERIRRVFRWGVENELVAPSVLHGLQAVRGLARGRTTAPETEPV